MSSKKDPAVVAARVAQRIEDFMKDETVSAGRYGMYIFDTPNHNLFVSYKAVDESIVVGSTFEVECRTDGPMPIATYAWIFEKN